MAVFPLNQILNLTIFVSPFLHNYLNLIFFVTNLEVRALHCSNRSSLWILYYVPWRINRIKNWSCLLPSATLPSYQDITMAIGLRCGTPLSPRCLTRQTCPSKYSCCKSTLKLFTILPSLAVGTMPRLIPVMFRVSDILCLVSIGFGATAQINIVHVTDGLDAMPGHR